MKKVFVVLVLVTLLPLALMAEIVAGDMSGKVEIMKPGSQKWQTLSTGDSLPKDSTISTGFNSRVQLKVNDATTVELNPLTRLSIEEAVSTPGGDQNTKLFMGSGRIRANVKKNEGKSHNFQVRTPVATAAVRGTAFDMTPRNLTVREGLVRFSAGKSTYHVAKGQQTIVSEVAGQESVEAPLEEAVAQREVSVQAGPEAPEEVVASNAGNEATGYIQITLK